MLRTDRPMSEDHAHPFVFRVEISPEHVDAIAPRLREALAASGNDGEINRRAEEVAEREARLRDEQAELDERARRLSEREAELGTSDDLTASERIRLAERRKYIEQSQEELDQREHELIEREAHFEGDVVLREERIEQWRAELMELEEHLERRERDLTAYVAQVQAVFDGADRLTPDFINAG